VPIALGSDTAGSIRIPATYCGVVGFKPLPRSIPRRGVVPVMPSFETPGVLARSVGDCVRAYRALRGNRGGGDGEAGAGEGRLRVALAADLLEESDERVAGACEAALESLDPRRTDVERLELGWRAEGFGVALAWELARTWGDRVDADPSAFTELIRSTVEFGRERGEEGYRSAMAGIERARARLRRRLSRYSALVCPTVPVPAPDRDRESTPVSTRFTRIFSALGWPAVSVPAGRDRGGRPIGVQVSAPPAGLAAVIEVARALERPPGGGAPS
jgi:aspartyl-tRNA(Asn)/glutamyl-tRNA(Gln) amidotransferase subunit A